MSPSYPLCLTQAALVYGAPVLYVLLDALYIPATEATWRESLQDGLFKFITNHTGELPQAPITPELFTWSHAICTKRYNIIDLVAP